jgi:hypothetical protein
MVYPTVSVETFAPDEQAVARKRESPGRAERRRPRRENGLRLDFMEIDLRSKRSETL